MNDIVKKGVLNAGSGSHKAGKVPAVFSPTKWQETRLDIDPGAQPDLVGSICDMRAIIGDAQFDALWSSHAIEHLHAHEVIPAFREFRRILKPNGFALLTCPDLMAIARQLLNAGAEAVAYESPAGPIRAIDMLYGHGLSIGNGHLAMAHNTGFTGPRIARIALAAGFSEVRMIEGDTLDLFALLLTPEASLETIAPMFAGTRLAGLFAGAAVQASLATV